MDDAAIVALYLQRDETAIRCTSEQYGARLHALANGILHDVHTADECVNDVYLQAWNTIPPHEPAEYFFAFLARIARHTALDRLRREGRKKRSAVLVELSAEMAQCLPASEGASDRLEAAELARAVSAFLCTEPEQARAVFLRRYWYFDSIAALADRFSMRESKVKSLLFRTRNRLRTYLEKEGYCP